MSFRKYLPSIADIKGHLPSAADIKKLLPKPTMRNTRTALKVTVYTMVSLQVIINLIDDINDLPLLCTEKSVNDCVLKIILINPLSVISIVKLDAFIYTSAGNMALTATAGIINKIRNFPYDWCANKVATMTTAIGNFLHDNVNNNQMNKIDPAKKLTRNAALHILSFLDAKTIGCKIKKVSRDWNKIAEDPAVYYCLIKREKIPFTSNQNPKTVYINFTSKYRYPTFVARLTHSLKGRDFNKGIFDFSKPSVYEQEDFDGGYYVDAKAKGFERARKLLQAQRTREESRLNRAISSVGLFVVKKLKKAENACIIQDAPQEDKFEDLEEFKSEYKF